MLSKGKHVYLITINQNTYFIKKCVVAMDNHQAATILSADIGNAMRPRQHDAA